jgi:hypothetical protein
MDDIKVITKTDEALRMTNGTTSQSVLHNVTYDELKKTFGDPIIDRPSSDNKVNVEWVFVYKDEPYSLYDYKTSSLKTNRKWIVNGGKNYQGFLSEIRKELKNKLNKEFNHGIY